MGNFARDSAVDIAQADWMNFLATFSRRYHGWLVKLETYDLDTREKVTTPELPLQSIELDLEDEKNPRINVTLQLDNKILTHILFLPSELIWVSSNADDQSLYVGTINTETTIRLRPRRTSDERWIHPA